MVVYYNMASHTIKVHDLTFKKYISHDDIQNKISSIAKDICSHYISLDNLVVVGILTGSYMVISDLSKHLPDCHVTFMKVSSYKGTKSTGKFRVTLPLSVDIEGKDVLIVEDIVDSGKTINFLYSCLQKMRPNSINIFTMFIKREVFKSNLPKLKNLPTDPVRFSGFDIEDKFVMGYGMDYNELGRTYPDLYQKVDISL